MLSLDADDPVTIQLRASRRRLVGVAVFSGVVNLLTLSGSIYMLQVYDRVIPEPQRCNVGRAVGDYGDRLFVARLFRCTPQPYAGADRRPIRR